MSDVNIVRINPETGIVSFGFSLFPKKVSGIEALLQLSAKTILTTPGKDIFAKYYGGGLISYAGQNLHINNIARIRADIAYIVSDSERQIKEEQILKQLPMSERLAEQTLLGIDFDSDKSGLNIWVAITASDGTTSDLTLSTQIYLKR